MFFSFCPLLSSVWLPEQWGPESWCLLFKLVACSSVWPPAINGYFQPCFWKRHERLLWQRAPQLQHRYWHLPESTPSTAGLYHGTHTCGKWGGGYHSHTKICPNTSLTLCPLVYLSQELDMLKEVSEASVSMNEGVTQLQTQPCFQSLGEKHTLCKWKFAFTCTVKHTYFGCSY